MPATTVLFCISCHMPPNTIFLEFTVKICSCIANINNKKTEKNYVGLPIRQQQMLHFKQAAKKKQTIFLNYLVEPKPGC